MVYFLLDIAPAGTGSDPLVIITMVVMVIAVAVVIAVATGIFVFIRVRRSRAMGRAIGEGWAGTQPGSLSESASNSPKR